MAKTKCECPLAGYCERHGVTKTPHEHTLCKNHPGAFKKWEDAVQKEEVPVKNGCPFCNNEGCTGECRNQQKTPSVLQMAKNLAGSMKEAVKDGFATEGKDEVERRMEICRGCEYFIPNSNRCSACGCMLNYKAKLKSGKCPKGKW